MRNNRKQIKEMLRKEEELLSLKKKIDMTNEEMKSVRGTCEHAIKVFLGSDNDVHEPTHYCACALCGEMGYENLINNGKSIIINASNYKKDLYIYNMNIFSKRSHKLKEIRYIILNILADNPQITMAELKIEVEKITNPQEELEKIINLQKTMKAKR